MVEIKLTSSRDVGQDHAHQAIDAAFLIIEKIQHLMSFHDANSQLSQLNREAHLRAIPVHPFVYAVLIRAQKIFLASEGLFDCTVADVLVDWSLLPQQGDQASPEAVTQADVMLLADYMVQYRTPLLIDFGGIAKGFAVDLAIQTLRQCGIKNAVVNAGGDLRVLGHNAEPISVRSPSNVEQLISVGELSAGALATSGIYYSETSHQGQSVSALVNPINRQPVLNQHSFSVIAPTAWLADALTKVVAVSGNIEHPCLSRFGAKAFTIY